MTSKLAFVARFLLAFAVFIVLGWMSDAPARYARLLRESAAVLSPVTNGWWIETRPSPRGQEIVFRHADHTLPLLLSLESLALSLLPLLSLLSATPGLSPTRWFLTVALGASGLFGLDLFVVLLYPLLVYQPNAATDILGTFLGLLTFVGGPIILWFALTFPQLRGVWRLDRLAPAARAGK